MCWETTARPTSSLSSTLITTTTCSSFVLSSFTSQPAKPHWASPPSVQLPRAQGAAVTLWGLILEKIYFSIQKVTSKIWKSPNITQEEKTIFQVSSYLPTKTWSGTRFPCLICKQKIDNVSTNIAFISQGKTEHQMSGWTGESVLGTGIVLLFLYRPSHCWQKYTDRTPKVHWDWQAGSMLHSRPLRPNTCPETGVRTSSTHKNRAGSRRRQ